MTYFGKPIAYTHRGRGIERQHLQRFTEIMFNTMRDLNFSEREVSDILARINAHSSDIFGGHGSSG